MKQIYIASTRFTSLTWEENINYKKKINFQGSLYNVPMMIKDSINSSFDIYVIEMNNDTNKIMGIGLIRNIICYDKYYKIHKIQNYNRYTYKSNYRIDREDILKNRENIDIIKKLEFRVFRGIFNPETEKGKRMTHLKLSNGITEVPKDILNDYTNFILKLKPLII